MSRASVMADIAAKGVTADEFDALDLSDSVTGGIVCQNQNTFSSAVTVGSASKNTLLAGPITISETVTFSGVVTIV